ncbi:MAG TPA: hypothetical protein VGS19_36130 [Streptosporangiaceae bacterium]|nr:hypothetical protein [Streptosporangiaceae bacterium]
MSYSADPAHRQRFILGLRGLAEFLDANPAVPVPLHGEQITVHVNSTEEGGCFQVRQAARLLGVAVTDDTRHGGHFHADKPFGPITYRIVAIPDTCMARHRALWSYHGAVEPETTLLDA